MRGILLAGAIVLACASEASACFSGARMYPDTVAVDAQMAVRSGGSCSLAYRSFGGIESVTVSQRASHGAVDLAGAQVRYRSNKGYVGRDSFTLTVRGRDHLNNAKTTAIRVAVTIK